MKMNVFMIVIAAGLLINVIMMRAPVGGEECTAGIKKGHLDPAPGAFVDDETIEIDAANGLRIKDGALIPAKIDSIFGSWTHYDSEEHILVVDINYQATSDGFICVYGSGTHAGGGVRILTSSSNPATKPRVGEGDGWQPLNPLR